MSQETGVGEGGYVVWERIRYGYISQANTLGSNFMNSYCAGGKQETYYVDCTQRFGSLPDQWASFANKPLLGHGEISFMGPHFAHCSSGNKLGYWCSINDRTEDNRTQYPYATCGYMNERFTTSDLPGTDDDPLSWRVYWIGRECLTGGFTGTTEAGVSGGRNIQLCSRAWYINPKLRFHKSWGGSGYIQSVDGFYSLINADIEIIDTSTTNSGTLFVASVASSLRVWWYGGRLRAFATMPFSEEAVGNVRATFVAGASATNIRIAGVLLERPWQRVLSWSNSSIGSSPANNDTYLRYLAGLGVIDANQTFRRGFNGATGYVDLDSVTGGVSLSGPNLSDNSPLVGIVPVRPFSDVGFDFPEYDFDLKQRPASRSIGLYEPFSKITASAGGGGGSSMSTIRNVLEGKIYIGGVAW